MKQRTLEKPVASPLTQEAPPHWPPLLRAGFRFAFVYLGLYCAATQIAGSLFVTPSSSFRGLGLLWPMRDMTFWIGRRIFGVAGPLTYGRNSGETTFFWIQSFWLLALAIAAAAVWSALDRRRENYVTLHKWFRVFARFALAASMFEYGMTKVIPTQFPAPALTTLATPVGDLSLSALLWAAIGASPAYEIATGCAELLGGALLLVPRTTTLGALICLADMLQVFLLNITFDIGLKQISFHLILLSIFLLAPEAGRLADLLLLNRSPRPPTLTALFPTRRANRAALAVQAAFGVYLLATYAYINSVYWRSAGDGSPRSPLYGIWNVETLSVDGATGPASLQDYDRRWRRVIFDQPGAIAFQRTDDSFARYGAAIDVYGNTFELTKMGSRTWKAGFRFERRSEDALVLDGEMDGHRVHAELRRVEFDQLRLLNSGFRWVRPNEP